MKRKPKVKLSQVLTRERRLQVMLMFARMRLDPKYYRTPDGAAELCMVSTYSQQGIIRLCDKLHRLHMGELS